MALSKVERERREALSERVKTLLTKDAPRDAKWHMKVAQLVYDVVDLCAPRVLGGAPRSGDRILHLGSILRLLGQDNRPYGYAGLRLRLREELCEYVRYRTGEHGRDTVIGAEHSVCAALGRMVASQHGFENTSRGVAQMAEALLAALYDRGHVVMPRWLEDAESLGKSKHESST